MNILEQYITHTALDTRNRYFTVPEHQCMSLLAFKYEIEEVHACGHHLSLHGLRRDYVMLRRDCGEFMTVGNVK